MKRHFLALALMVATFDVALSQVNLNVDFGYEGLFSSSPSVPEQIRENNYSKYVYVNSFRINIMPEFQLKDRFSIMSGLRLSYNQGVFKNKKNSYNKEEYCMYWVAGSQGDDIYYYTIDKIEQKTTYIGVPIVGKFNIRGNDVFISPFLKCGCSFNFGIKNKYNAVMGDSKMSIHKSEIEDAIDDGNAMYTSVWGSAGVQLGSKQKFSIEIIVPTFFIGTHSAFSDYSNWGGGAAVSWIVPLSKSNN